MVNGRLSVSQFCVRVVVCVCVRDPVCSVEADLSLFVKTFFTGVSLPREWSFHEPHDMGMRMTSVFLLYRTSDSTLALSPPTTAAPHSLTFKEAKRQNTKYLRINTHYRETPQYHISALSYKEQHL